MTSLPTIIDQVYPTISIQINPAQRRFLGTLARIADCTPETMASNMLGQALEIEAAQVIDALSPGTPAPTVDVPTTPGNGEPTLTFGAGQHDFLSNGEIEEAAAERHELTKND